VKRKAKKESITKTLLFHWQDQNPLGAAPNMGLLETSCKKCIETVSPPVDFPLKRDRRLTLRNLCRGDVVLWGARTTDLSTGSMYDGLELPECQHGSLVLESGQEANLSIPKTTTGIAVEPIFCNDHPLLTREGETANERAEAEWTLISDVGRLKAAWPKRPKPCSCLSVDSKPAIKPRDSSFSRTDHYQARNACRAKTLVWAYTSNEFVASDGRAVWS